VLPRNSLHKGAGVGYERGESAQSRGLHRGPLSWAPLCPQPAVLWALKRALSRHHPLRLPVVIALRSHSASSTRAVTTAWRCTTRQAAMDLYYQFVYVSSKRTSVEGERVRVLHHQIKDKESEKGIGLKSASRKGPSGIFALLTRVRSFSSRFLAKTKKLGSVAHLATALHLAPIPRTIGPGTLVPCRQDWQWRCVGLRQHPTTQDASLFV
jgi:hypothetical protein